MINNVQLLISIFKERLTSIASSCFSKMVCLSPTRGRHFSATISFAFSSVQTPRSMRSCWKVHSVLSISVSSLAWNAHLSCSLSLSLSHTHTHTHTRTDCWKLIFVANTKQIQSVITGYKSKYNMRYWQNFQKLMIKKIVNHNCYYK